jgi:site-specific DNA-methyltransferase (adenine-specific)
MNDIFNTDVPLKTETPAFAKHVLPAVPSSEVYLEDCVTALKRFNDNHFDLAIVDPPYGIDWMEQVKNPNKGKNWKQYENKDWDKSIPSAEYFEELKRVSKNQIVWGGNYMTEYLKPSPCWLIWDKMQEFSGAVFEMAWTSFSSPAKAFRMSRVEAYTNQSKIHPTQKPTKLYDWILQNYAQPNDLILDTHLGSGSSRIAAYKGGFNFVGFEIDKEYYDKQEKRFNDFKSQLRLF